MAPLSTTPDWVAARDLREDASGATVTASIARAEQVSAKEGTASSGGEAHTQASPTAPPA